MDGYSGDGDDGGDVGYLTAYGALIVPPASEEGGWFVAIAEWDVDSERYRASMDGPMFDTQEEAFDAARDLLRRIETSGENDDLMRIWEEVQRAHARDEISDQEPPNPHWRGW